MRGSQAVSMRSRYAHDLKSRRTERFPTQIVAGLPQAVLDRGSQKHGISGIRLRLVHLESLQIGERNPGRVGS